MKKNLSMAILALAVSIGTVSCKKKVSDADLSTQATKVISTNSSATVEVKDGVARLNGTYASVEERDAAIIALRGVAGIKDVQDNTTIEDPVVITSTVTPEVQQKVKDALKDYPTVKVEVINNELTLTGNVTPAQARKIKESVDALKVGKVNYNYIVK